MVIKSVLGQFLLQFFNFIYISIAFNLTELCLEEFHLFLRCGQHCSLNRLMIPINMFNYLLFNAFILFLLLHQSCSQSIDGLLLLNKKFADSFTLILIRFTFLTQECDLIRQTEVLLWRNQHADIF